MPPSIPRDIFQGMKHHKSPRRLRLGSLIYSAQLTPCPSLRHPRTKRVHYSKFQNKQFNGPPSSNLEPFIKYQGSMEKVQSAANLVRNINQGFDRRNRVV